MKKYEYLRRINLDLQGFELNNLGAHGWKVIDVRHDNESTWADQYLFMREIGSGSPVSAPRMPEIKPPERLDD